MKQLIQSYKTGELGLFEVEETASLMEKAGLIVEYDPDGLTGRGLYIGKLKELSNQPDTGEGLQSA